MRVLIIGSILVSSTCPLFAALSPSAQRGQIKASAVYTHPASENQPIFECVRTLSL